MKKRYTVIIYSPQDLNHSSYVQTGLFQLESAGLIECKVKYNISKKKSRVCTLSGKVVKDKQPQLKTSYYKIIDNLNKTEINFAMDLYDIAYYFSDYALSNCTYLFKRNYQTKFVKPIANSYDTKILPVGLSFGTQGENQEHWFNLKWGFIVSFILVRLKIDRNFITRIKKINKTVKRHLAYVTKGRSFSFFMKYQKLSINTKPTVFYQVRCFPDVESTDVKILHNQRSQMIRTLKKELGDSFVGGLVPCKIALDTFPDCITNNPTDPVSYINLIKSSSICIYTRGLESSPARKLPEYLSQAKCIVSERFETELPVALEHGKHIMYYDTIQECAEICKELINNPEKIKELSFNARAYFEEHIHPRENITRILKIMGCEI